MDEYSHREGCIPLHGEGQLVCDTLIGIQLGMEMGFFGIRIGEKWPVRFSY